MHSKSHLRPTIGFLSTWSIYEGTTIDNYTHAQHDPAHFDAGMQQIFDWIEAHGEEAYPWQTALSTLRRGLPTLLSLNGSAETGFADMLVDRARLGVAETAQRQATEVLLRHMDTSNRLGLMTSQLLTALDLSASTSILEQHLPQLGVNHALVALYSPREDDPLSHGTLLLGMNLKIIDSTDMQAMIGIDEYITACYGTTEYSEDLTGVSLALKGLSGTETIQYAYQCREAQVENIQTAEALVPQVDTRLSMRTDNGEALGYFQEGFAFSPMYTIGIKKFIKGNGELQTWLKVEKAS